MNVYTCQLCFTFNVLSDWKVLLVCGNKTEITSITEPETCNYLLRFKTPLVCDPRSLLVYPTLSEELQEEWNVLEGMLTYGDVTQKVGYADRFI